jgi:hypothetical protein
VGSARRACLGGFADICDEVVAGKEGAIEDDVAGLIDSYDGCVGRACLGREYLWDSGFR